VTGVEMVSGNTGFPSWVAPLTLTWEVASNDNPAVGWDRCTSAKAPIQIGSANRAA